MNKKNLMLLGFGLAAGLLIGVVGSPTLFRSGVGGSQISASETGVAASAKEASHGDGAADWCAGHRVPESLCTKCNPSLIPTFKTAGDWCGEHDLPESQCRLCNPGLTFPQEPNDATVSEAESDWCVGHRVPESLCTKCNPSLIPTFKTAGDWCGEHGLPESQCRLCNPGLTFLQEPEGNALSGVETPVDESYRPTVFFPKNGTGCATADAIIQFASAETAERTGLTLVPAVEIKQSVSAEAPAEVLFDETRSYAITTTVPALVVRWLAEPGQHVSAGQALAELESPEMPRLKADYLEASAEAQLKGQEFGRADSLNRKGLISAAEYQQIESALSTTQARLSSARGLLQACGLTGDDLTLIASGRSLTPRWFLRAATSGTFLERRTTLGELLPAGSRFGLVGNPNSLWIEAHVRESDLSLFRTGQTVEFTSDGEALEKVSGRVIWVAQYVDPLTRSATVRAEIANSALDLRAHQFGRIALSIPPVGSTVAVPRDAVQWEGCCNVVFIREAPAKFRPHKVTISRGDRGYYNVSSGIQAGDMVVVKGSYLLKTELKKGSLGVGCCGIAPEA